MPSIDRFANKVPIPRSVSAPPGKFQSPGKVPEFKRNNLGLYRKHPGSAFGSGSGSGLVSIPSPGPATAPSGQLPPSPSHSIPSPQESNMRPTNGYFPSTSPPPSQAPSPPPRARQPLRRRTASLGGGWLNEEQNDAKAQRSIRQELADLSHRVNTLRMTSRSRAGSVTSQGLRDSTPDLLGEEGYSIDNDKDISSESREEVDDDDMMPRSKSKSSRRRSKFYDLHPDDLDELYTSDHRRSSRWSSPARDGRSSIVHGLRPPVPRNLTRQSEAERYLLEVVEHARRVRDHDVLVVMLERIVSDTMSLYNHLGPGESGLVDRVCLSLSDFILQFVNSDLDYAPGPSPMTNMANGMVEQSPGSRSMLHHRGGLAFKPPGGYYSSPSTAGGSVPLPKTFSPAPTPTPKKRFETGNGSGGLARAPST